jgi:hypothetical protein
VALIIKSCTRKKTSSEEKHTFPDPKFKITALWSIYFKYSQTDFYDYRSGTMSASGT